MELLVAVLTGWAALSVLAVVGAAAVCRAGHVEDVARGFAEPELEASRPGRSPSGRPAEVTAR